MSNSVSIKICGINNSESAKACTNADYVGLVFFQKSVRFVTAFQAKKLTTFLPKKSKKVGLFVNSDLGLIEHITKFVDLDLIQLHGDESISVIKAIKQRLNKPIIKAISIDSIKDVELSKKYETCCDMILFDTKLKNSEINGGTGVPFNWNLLKNYNSKKKWIVAGGLSVKNVKKAIEITGAPIVDISSGVEEKKGIKCPKKIREFISYVKKNKFTKI